MPRHTTLSRVLKYVRHAKQALNRREFYPRSSSQLDLVLLALMSKSIITAEAVCSLVGAGYHEEAFGLTRTLVDLYFTVRYISNKDSLERAEKFANFFAKDYEGWLKIITKYYPTKHLDLRGDHTTMVTLAKSYRHPHKWTGLPDQTRRMAVEPSTHDKTPSGDPVDATFDYEAIYKWTSHYVHPTVVALDTHAIDLGGKFFVHAGKLQRKRFKNLSTFNVVSFLGGIFVCGMRGLGSKVPKSLDEELDHLIRTIK
ncbi:MAG: DUF5677 domain-containing protein [Terriglobia bacterium]|jgi:hypothetical protein